MAVRTGNERMQVQMARVDRRMRRHWGMAGASDGFHERPLCTDRGVRDGIVQPVEQVGAGVVACFEGQGALTDGGDEHLGIERLGSRRLEAKSLQPGSRQDDGVELAGSQFAQARVDVAA